MDGYAMSVGHTGGKMEMDVKRICDTDTLEGRT